MCVCLFQADFKSWQTVFYLTAGILFSSVVNFTLFSSSERQEWDSSAEDSALLINDSGDTYKDEPSDT